MSAKISIENLQLLINELTKNQPDPSLVKSLFKKNNWTCPEDPTDQMAFVLEFLDKQTSFAMNASDEKNKFNYKSANNSQIDKRNVQKSDFKAAMEK